MTRQSDEPAPERSDDHAAERLEEFVRERFPGTMRHLPPTSEAPGASGTDLEGASSP